jgi:L-threonylcarbamoyladenylate synthase
MILPGSDVAAIAQAAQALRAGELVGIPTETVYGLAADADNEAAVAQIFAAKGRPTDHPLIVHLASSAQVARYAAQVPDFAQRLIDAFWPGPLTLILPRRPGVATAAAGGQDSIGLRCPSHPVAQALLRACGLGLAAPSANRFGRVSPTTAAHVQAELGSALLVLDGGPCPVGIESTLVDCTRGARGAAARPDHARAAASGLRPQRGPTGRARRCRATRLRHARVALRPASAGAPDASR